MSPVEAGTEDDEAGDIGGSSDSILILVLSGLSSILEKLLLLFEDVKEKDVWLLLMLSKNIFLFLFSSFRVILCYSKVV